MHKEHDKRGLNSAADYPDMSGYSPYSGTVVWLAESIEGFPLSYSFSEWRVGDAFVGSTDANSANV